jgi:hypothetical protein
MTRVMLFSMTAWRERKIHEKSENLSRSVTVQFKVGSPDESEPQLNGT